MIIGSKSSDDIIGLLKLSVNSVYLVKVRASKNNIEHKVILFTDRGTWSHYKVYNISYTEPTLIRELYSISVIKKLTNL